MKFTKSTVLIFFTFLILNCSKSEAPNPEPKAEEKPDPDTNPEEPIEPKNEVYFSYYSDPNDTYSQWNDNWIILHDQGGELLDYRQFAIGDSLEFKKSAEMLLNVQTLSVTVLKHRLGEGGGHHHAMDTRTSINKGTVWGWAVNEPKILNPPKTNSAQIGITVNNVPNVHWFELSSQPQGHLEGHPFYQETDVLEIGGVRLYKDISYLLSLRDGNEEIKYQILELPDPFSNIVLNYDDFLEYDNVLEVELPDYKSYAAYVSARNKSINYSNSFSISRESSGRQPRSVAKLGYINSFDTFHTDLVLHYDDQTTYNRYKIGVMPTSINVPEDPQFQAYGNTIYDYSFTTNQDYYRNTSYWTYEDEERDIITRYSFGGKSDNGVLTGTLPDQVLENFPYLNLDNLNRELTSLTIGENVDHVSDDIQTIFGLIVQQDIETIKFKTSD
ncbi:hypothetical protein SAMN05421636_1244 [Pricia antarctica]|uniref:Lipoprotein n=1 Tax=Pricia antarctica TaxID=641691 RepID=A0A1G7JEB3_9FLAO|nr:hypothetical protein [Pricia antarctica]SDF23248.1 hypothetical protein SAMN05421636_1244 [Pricia antarctica]